ncbi:MAG: hypothetical protein WC603_00865 [Candidatus Paceibacterota bacterium]|jgi:hypothetical protein
MKKIILTSETGLEIINALNKITQNHYFTIEKWYSNENLPLSDDDVSNIKWGEQKDTLKNITVKAGYTSGKGYNSDYGCIVMSLSPLAFATHFETGSIFYIFDDEIVVGILNGKNQFLYRRYSIEKDSPETKNREYCNQSEADNYRMHLGEKWENDNMFGVSEEED